MMEINKNTNTNVTSDSESGPFNGTINRDHFNQYYTYGITFRPNEHKLVSLGSKRKKYGSFSLDEQKEILQNTIFHMSLRGVNLYDINFETTKLKENESIHFHAIFQCKEGGSVQNLIAHSDLLNTRYGPKTYKAFDYKLLSDEEALDRWIEYIHKDIQHPQLTWCCGI